MALTLATAALAAGYRLAHFDTIGSTSTEAMSRARAGERGPLWVVARRQSAGLGRRGSAWQTPEGNLAASLLLTTDLPPARIATLGFVAGLALGWALDRCSSVEAGPCPAPRNEDRVGASSNRPHAKVPLSGLEARAPFALKWPNDVLADGAKLAGILLGTEEVAPGLRAVTVGIGVNVAHAPANLPYTAASLRSLGWEVGVEALFVALSAAWVEAHGIWTGEGGFDAIRRLWLARAAGLGSAVAVRTGLDVTQGIFETIDEHGQLVVRTADGSARTVSAGEVHFGVAGSATPELRA